MSGWLPIEIVLDQYPALVWPGLVPEATVRWIHFGNKRLVEPFYSQSVARLRESDNPALEIETPIESLVREGDRNMGLLPIGFIFHISRCGSTLICNALKTLEGAQVITEARPITRLFMPCQPADGASADSQRDEERAQLASSLFNVFSCYRTGHAEPIIVKFTSQNSICLSTIRRLWPNVPCLFVIRDPIAVMVSNLKDGGLSRFTQSPKLAYEMSGTSTSVPLSDISVEEFCARVLSRYFNAALGEIGPNVRIIDYDDITPQRIYDIARFFQLDPAFNQGRLDGVFKHYSKDAVGSRTFYCDRIEKSEAANRRIVDAANGWVASQYAQLRFATRWS
jgi:hypothetical protein